MVRKKRTRKLDEDVKINRISIADFEIESNVVDMPELEECMNRLIEKNMHFAEFRRKKLLGEHMGMIG